MDQTPFLVRTASEADAKNLSAMMIASWRESYSALIAPTKLNHICDNWLSSKQFEERIADQNACNLLAVCNGRIVGHSYVLPKDKNSLLVAYLYVLKQHAGRGIGTTLLNSSVACFPGTSHIELGVLRDNHAAIEFYKAFGFFEAGPEPKQIDEPASIKMTMAL